MSDLTTTRARAWALTRRDGVTLGFTDHDRDLSFDGVVFRAGSGLSAQALVHTLGLSADNTGAVGALSDAGLTEADILAGRYDGADITLWEVDWNAAQDRRILFRGTLGTIARAGGAFRAELRGLAAPLAEARGRVFGAACPAVLGDGACRADLDLPGLRTEAEVLRLEEGGAVLFLPDLPDFAEGWFADGRAAFVTGAAIGLPLMVRRDLVQETTLGLRRVLTLWTAPGVLPAVGDWLSLEAGCDKRFQTCRFKFANAVNFQGFPHIPAEDWLIAPPRAEEE